MAKKMLKKKVSRKPAAKNAAAPVMESARDVWLAGLGAFSVAQQESGRILEQGSKLFEQLVAEGSKIESKTRKDVGGAVEGIRSEVESRVEEMKQQAGVVRKQATDNWDKLEKIFEDRVARAVARLGIPGKDDVLGLAEKVQKLARQVAELGSTKPAAQPKARPTVKKSAGKKVARKSLPKKAAVKKALPKKPVTKKALPKKPVTKKALPKKSGVKKPLIKKTVAKKTAAKKKIAKKVAVKSAAATSGANPAS